MQEQVAPNAKRNIQRLDFENNFDSNFGQIQFLLK